MKSQIKLMMYHQITFFQFSAGVWLHLFCRFRCNYSWIQLFHKQWNIYKFVDIKSTLLKSSTVEKSNRYVFRWNAVSHWKFRNYEIVLNAWSFYFEVLKETLTKGIWWIFRCTNSLPLFFTIALYKWKHLFNQFTEIFIFWLTFSNIYLSNNFHCTIIYKAIIV